MSKIDKVLYSIPEAAKLARMPIEGFLDYLGDGCVRAIIKVPINSRVYFVESPHYELNEVLERSHDGEANFPSRAIRCCYKNYPSWNFKVGFLRLSPDDCKVIKSHSFVRKEFFIEGLDILSTGETINYYSFNDDNPRKILPAFGEQKSTSGLFCCYPRGQDIFLTGINSYSEPLEFDVSINDIYVLGIEFGIWWRDYMSNQVRAYYYAKGWSDKLLDGESQEWVEIGDHDFFCLVSDEDHCMPERGNEKFYRNNYNSTLISRDVDYYRKDRLFFEQLFYDEFVASDRFKPDQYESSIKPEEIVKLLRIMLRLWKNLPEGSKLNNVMIYTELKDAGYSGRSLKVLPSFIRGVYVENVGPVALPKSSDAMTMVKMTGFPKLVELWKTIWMGKVNSDEHQDQNSVVEKLEKYHYISNKMLREVLAALIRPPFSRSDKEEG